MKKIELLGELGRYAVFNLKIVKELTGKDSNYAKLAVYRLKRDKFIFEIEKNKYTLHKDLMIIATNIIWPCYLSCWSALRYYNLTEQLPQTLFVITTKTRKKRKISLNNENIIFIKIKPKYFFGYRKERYGDFDIFIAEKEKALIDSALFKKISFSEICDIIKSNVNSINIELLISYLIKIKSKALIKRFGFLLDKVGIDKHNELKRFIDFKYIPADYAVMVRGKKNKKWKIIENVKL